MSTPDPAHPNLSQLRQAIAALPLSQQREVRDWLNTLIAEAESAALAEALLPIPQKLGREVVEQKRVGRLTYQYERVRCGKPKCKCARGELHGPYWYGYQKSGSKLKSWYIGKVWSEAGNES